MAPPKTIEAAPVPRQRQQRLVANSSSRPLPKESDDKPRDSPANPQI